MAKHFALSPSSFTRLNCSAAIQSAAGMPNSAGSAADEGTRAHDVAAKTLLTGAPPSRFTDDDEMTEAVNVYVDEIDRIRNEASLQHEAIEDTIGPLASDLPLGGTPDYAAWSAETLYIFDLKYGVGHDVGAERNPQLGAYGLLLWKLGQLQVERVVLTVVQPRCPTSPPIKTWETSPTWLEELHQRIREAYHGPQKYATGEHCRWCLLRNKCPALVQMQNRLAVTTFNAADCDVEDLSRLALAASAIRANLKDAVGRLTELARQGNDIPWMKLVSSQGCRRWSIDDEPELILELKKSGVAKSKATETKLRSPAQLETLLGDDLKFQHLVERPNKGLLVVPLSDRRAAVQLSSANIVFAER